MLNNTSKEEQILDTLAAEDTAHVSVDVFLADKPRDVSHGTRTAMAVLFGFVARVDSFMTISDFDLYEIASSLVDRFFSWLDLVLQDCNAIKTFSFVRVKTMETKDLGSAIGSWQRWVGEIVLPFCLWIYSWMAVSPNDHKPSAALRLALLQCEFAVIHEMFIAVPASTIACTALMNAFESMSNCRPVRQQQQLLDSMLGCLQKALGYEICRTMSFCAHVCLKQLLLVNAQRRRWQQLNLHSQNKCDAHR